MKQSKGAARLFSRVNKMLKNIDGVVGKLEVSHIHKRRFISSKYNFYLKICGIFFCFMKNFLHPIFHLNFDPDLNNYSLGIPVLV